MLENTISLADLARLLGIDPDRSNLTKLRRRVRAKEKAINRTIASRPGRKIFLSKSDIQTYFPEWIKRDQQITDIVREELAEIRESILDLNSRLSGLASRVRDNKRQIATLSPKG